MQLRCPPEERPLQISDFLMSALDQMLGGDAGSKFLINVDGRAFVSQIGIDGHDWHIAADVLQIAQIDLQREVEQNAANLVRTKFIHGPANLWGGLVDDAAEHET